MKILVRDTIINDEYSVMTKTDDVKKIATKIASSPNGVVIVKGRDSKILGVVTFREIINNTLKKKDLSKLKFNDIIQTNIMMVEKPNPKQKMMIIKDTDNIERVIKRMNRRKPVAAVVINEKDQLVGYFSESDKSYAEACQKVVNNILR